MDEEEKNYKIEALNNSFEKLRLYGCLEHPGLRNAIINFYGKLRTKEVGNEYVDGMISIIEEKFEEINASKTELVNGLAAIVEESSLKVNEDSKNKVRKINGLLIFSLK